MSQLVRFLLSYRLLLTGGTHMHTLPSTLIRTLSLCCKVFAAFGCVGERDRSQDGLLTMFHDARLVHGGDTILVPHASLDAQCPRCRCAVSYLALPCRVRSLLSANKEQL